MRKRDKLRCSTLTRQDNRATNDWTTDSWNILFFQVYYTTQGYTMYEYSNLTVRASFQGDGWAFAPFLLISNSNSQWKSRRTISTGVREELGTQLHRAASMEPACVNTCYLWQLIPCSEQSSITKQLNFATVVKTSLIWIRERVAAKCSSFPSESHNYLVSDSMISCIFSFSHAFPKWNTLS